MGCGSYNVVRSRPPTPEEQAQIDEGVRRFEVRQKEARGAEERALVLLDARLGPTEARLFKRTHTLMRPSRLWPGVEYLIPDGGHEMVKVVNRGREQTRLCVVSAAGEPWPDRTMTILDLIESGQERRLWEMANVFSGQDLTPPLLVRESLTWQDVVTALILGIVVIGTVIGVAQTLIFVWGGK